MKYIVLSGFSGGMGFETAKTLSQNGYFVFGLDINEPQTKLPNTEFIQTNLRDTNSIKAAFDYIKNKCYEIEAIISMAGIYDLNSLVEMKEEDFIRIFDINVFAIYRLNKMFLSLLKKKGKIIMVSSELAPLDPLPFTGIYGISKSAIEKYAYALRMEVQLLDIYVSIIRPGAVATSLLDVSTSRIDKFAHETELYKYNANKFQKITTSVESRKIPASKIGQLTLKIVKKKKPKYVYKINRNPLLLILNFLPQRLQNYIIKKILLSK